MTLLQSSGDNMDPDFIQGFPGPPVLPAISEEKSVQCWTKRHSDILVHQIKYLQTPVKSEQVDSFIK